MTVYGIAQTLFLPQKIVYYAWTGVLFWFTASSLVMFAAQVGSNKDRARWFRSAFVLFGSAICVLELLEQASRTNRYFWFLPSKFPAVYGTFAYWNNFAEFIELFFPVTLWSALSKRRPDVPYIVLSAIQISAVIASGSRAGSALVILELIAVLSLLYLRNRNRAFLYASAATIVLAAVFIYAAGVSQVIEKLHQHDQLSVRRDINASTIAMIKARPLTGWGLNSFVAVYPMFARFDTGVYINRAHNDWLQWAAEGGVFFAVLMAAVLVWSFRPAVRSVWGIGVIVVCLHALVDYPFARCGVCGWYFALLGLLANV
ncbi:MAG: O-antigen ligase family protein [Acidobacteriaceae bacterium]|nr:O-antigen ligase family protein [Acidobacteriaceae bacterium]